MAFKTLRIDVLGVYQLIGYGPMGIVAIRALHFVLSNRMMGSSQQLWCNFSMTADTDFSLGRFCQVFRIFLMDTVTIGAGKRPHIMLAGAPHGRFAFAVAFQAKVVLFLLRFRRAGAQRYNVAAFILFCMGGSRTMTRLADIALIAGGRGSRVPFDSVDVFPESIVNFFMAFHAGFIAGKIAVFLIAAGIQRKN